MLRQASKLVCQKPIENWIMQINVMTRYVQQRPT